MIIKLIQTIFISMLATFSLNAEVAYNLQTLTANGGDGVAISSEWAFVGDADLCYVHIYRFDYTQMKWGDGLGGTVNPFQSLGGNCDKGGFRDFGASISYSSGWLFIGAPANRKDNNKEGSVHYYYFDGTEWQTPKNSPYTIGEKGGGFGASVSLRSYDDTTLLAVVGAPFDHNTSKGETLSTAPGRAYAYLVNITTPTDPVIDERINTSGESAGDQFGYSVTSDGTRFLIGAPYHDTTDTGRVYLYADYNDTTPEHFDGASAGDNRGQELSLSSSNYMITTGQVSDVLDGSEPVPFTSYLSAPSNGGDASQSNGVVALGEKGSFVKIFGDISALKPADITIPAPNVDTNFSEDINLYKDQLIVNGYSHNEAYTYDFPCGVKPTYLVGNEWAMVSVPCGDGSATIDTIFGDDMASGSIYCPDDDPTTECNWVMYKDGTNHTGTSADNVRVLENEKMALGVGYWIIADHNVTLKADANVISARTTSDQLQYDLTAIGIPADKIAFVMKHINSVSNGSVQKIMVGNPFARAFKWSNVYFLNTDMSPSAYYLINDPILADTVQPTAYVYDITATGELPAQPYRAISAAGTPGIADEIQPYQGFWIQVNETSASGVNLIALPFEK